MKDRGSCRVSVQNIVASAQYHGSFEKHGVTNVDARGTDGSNRTENMVYYARKKLPLLRLFQLKNGNFFLALDK